MRVWHLLWGWKAAAAAIVLCAGALVAAVSLLPAGGAYAITASASTAAMVSRVTHSALGSKQGPIRSISWAGQLAAFIDRIQHHSDLTQWALARADFNLTTLKATLALPSETNDELKIDCDELLRSWHRRPGDRDRRYMLAKCQTALGSKAGKARAFGEARYHLLQAQRLLEAIPNPDVDEVKLLANASQKITAVSIENHDTNAAQEAAQDALAYIAPRKTNAQPDVSRELALWNGRTEEDLGNLAGANDPARAIDHYKAALRVFGHLAATPSVDTGSLSRVVVLQNKIGDLLLGPAHDPMGALVAYEAGLVAAEQQLDLNSKDGTHQRDVAVCHNRIGDARAALGDGQGARKEYEAGLKVTKKLAMSDPDNLDWQRDLSVSYSRIGNALVDQNRPKDALGWFEKDLVISKRLAESDPNSTDKRRDVMISQTHIAMARRAMGDFVGAAAAFRAAADEIDGPIADRAPALRRDVLLLYQQIIDTDVLAGARGRAKEARLEASSRARQWKIDDPKLRAKSRLADSVSPTARHAPTGSKSVEFRQTSTEADTTSDRGQYEGGGNL